MAIVPSTYFENTITMISSSASFSALSNKRPSLSPSTLFSHPSIFIPSYSTKVGFPGNPIRGMHTFGHIPKWPCVAVESHHPQQISHQSFSLGDNLSSSTTSQEAEGLLLDAVKMSFFERLSLAWKILFPTIVKKSTNAKIAKQRLKMILFSDRCAVSDEAKRKIVSNIVGALSNFVEIESQDKVQLSVSTDPDLGTVYSVTVPVRRVKPEYQDSGDSYRGISNIEFKDTGEKSGSVDVRFDFFLPANEE
ncbi:cell division topological specificity factor homolog, chloroplastic [Amborella trichopoda]|nr:cell division topological specificity factor homolog, chloroplastic [Amborella trichopoda]|eukprot:XP_006844856.2 cell division topological specificity factor homolog, chloroplastic [Amborella trichopoda]